MEFVVLILQDNKRRHVNFFYLQSTGNEDALRKIQHVIQLVAFEVDNIGQEFHMELHLEHTFTQSFVDEHLRLHSRFTWINKIGGQLQLPWEIEAVDCNEMKTYRSFIDSVWDQDAYKNVWDFVERELHIVSWFQPNDI